MDDQNKPDQPTSHLEPNDAPATSPLPSGAPVPPPPPGSEPAPQAVPQQPFSNQPVAPGQQPFASYQAPAPQSNGKAVGALVCGILAILLSWSIIPSIILGIVAIVLAGKAVKESGKDGKTTGGKVCGILGIVFSVLSLFAAIAIVGLGAYIGATYDSDSYYNDSSYSSSYEAPALEATEEEEKIKAAAVAELDKLKNKDSALVEQLAAEADENLREATDYSLTDLGVDPVAFVDWMLVDFDYKLDSATDYADGTGVVYVDVTMRDSLAFATTFMEDAQAAINSGEMQGMDEAAAKARLGELYQAAMDKTTDMTSDFISFDMVKVGDTWKVDEDSLDTQLDYLFGL